jgi:Xaa-Pro dipeptidase
MRRRNLERLAASLRTSDLDAVILNPGPTLTYLTGLHFHLMERPVRSTRSSRMQASSFLR